jgi:hypothetical protein
VRDARTFDSRTLLQIPLDWLSIARGWREIPFRWTRWENHTDPAVGGHDHCQLCWACICNHRELFPHEREEHAKRGCYRHAFYAENPDGTYIWICRSCFKPIAPDAGLIRLRRLRPLASEPSKVVPDENTALAD